MLGEKSPRILRARHEAVQPAHLQARRRGDGLAPGAVSVAILQHHAVARRVFLKRSPIQPTRFHAFSSDRNPTSASDTVRLARSDTALRLHRLQRIRRASNLPERDETVPDGIVVRFAKDREIRSDSLSDQLGAAVGPVHVRICDGRM